eukprot:TRINITY_DN175_c0_g2_i1.p2 TRINITY_DN175_c0_g2~~TRINITY_DN175_c0_g2_i1.p2  ORF type:complete len:530 (-),score=95.48 TRINITY_DN175_c0_g2_i1:2311-3900(-)
MGEPPQKKRKKPVLPAKTPYIPTYNGPSKQEVQEGRKKHLSAGQYTFYKEPLMLVDGAMQYVFDEQGRRYLDAYSNVCHIGHCHPHVCKAVQEAMSTVLTNTRYLHPTIVTYAEKLKSKLPPELDTVFFVNSGSEANDLAVRLARVYTKHTGVVVLQNAYHGTTATCTGMSTCLAPGDAGGCVDWKYCARDIYIAPTPDTYRNREGFKPEETALRYAELVAQTVDEECANNVAAFIHESVQGVGGQVVFPDGYLKAAYEAIRKRGGVCIADEVQVGFGRTGKHYWGFQWQDVVPDIVTMGKPIGNGYPLAAVVVKREIAQAFDQCAYFNTAGGNPVSCAAGLAVLETIDANELQSNALEMGAILLSELEKIKDNHQIVGDVRGLGLFAGVELVRDRHTKEPADKETAWVFERMKQLGVLVGKGGPNGNVLRIKPPICLNAEDVHFLVATLDKALTDLKSQGPSLRQEVNIAHVQPLVYHHLKELGLHALAEKFGEKAGVTKEDRTATTIKLSQAAKELHKLTAKTPALH